MRKEQRRLSHTKSRKIFKTQNRFFYNLSLIWDDIVFQLSQDKKFPGHLVLNIYIPCILPYTAETQAIRFLHSLSRQLKWSALLWMTSSLYVVNVAQKRSIQLLFGTKTRQTKMQLGVFVKIKQLIQTSYNNSHFKLWWHNRLNASSSPPPTQWWIFFQDFLIFNFLMTGKKLKKNIPITPKIKSIKKFPPRNLNPCSSTT